MHYVIPGYRGPMLSKWLTTMAAGRHSEGCPSAFSAGDDAKARGVQRGREAFRRAMTQRQSVTPRARHSVTVEFEAVKLRAGELAAALRSLEAKLFPGGDAMEGSFELSEVLPDGSTRTMRGGDPSLFEAVCTLGFDGHDLGITWNGEREHYLALAVRGSRRLRRVGSSLEPVPSILIQASSHDPVLMYRGLDGLREALGLRELEPEPEGATGAAALVAVSMVPDLTSGERSPARRVVLPRPRGRANEPGIRREHVKGLWALVAAIVSAIAAVIGAYLLKK